MADADGYDYAEVIDVDPIYRQVRVSVPRRECCTEIYAEPRHPVYRQGDRPAAGPMILGGLIGAVVGHQFGHGRGRDAGTVAGAVVGAAIGHDAAQRRAGRTIADVDAHRGRASRKSAARATRSASIARSTATASPTATTAATTCTQMPYEPGERIRVRVTVDPVGA